MGALAMKTMKAAMKKSGMKKAAMKKGMKAMKAMKAMKKKAMKKKAMKVSKIAKGKRARSSVFRGTKVKTQSGLAKSDMMKNKSGKIVSKCICRVQEEVCRQRAKEVV